MSLKIVTPILGGGCRTRMPDDIDLIRVPTIRGHLRFWWRALFASRLESAAALYEAETKLWGGPGGGPDKASAVRSPVEVCVEVTDHGDKETGDIDPQSTVGAYALFPARAERRGGQAIPRRIGLAFDLTIIAPAQDMAAVRDSVRAWILFGGYGGRTRRGLGGLSVTGSDVATWLPRHDKPLDAELRRLFGRDVFAAGGPPRQTPMLAGAALSTIGRIEDQGIPAWRTAVEALSSFRQGVPPNNHPDTRGSSNVPSEWARQPGFAPEPRRPSISNWPEPDKIRRLARRELGARPCSHPPRHNDKPVWPRAGFGLPIVGRFQKRRRGDGGEDYHEPPEFTLRWREPSGTPRDRLASPLIVKALSLAGGRFVAIALWLHRAWPAGEVFLEFKQGAVASSGARFDALTAPGEEPLFTALTNKPTLRAAFFDWLALHRKATTVFPHRDVGGGTP